MRGARAASDVKGSPLAARSSPATSDAHASSTPLAPREVQQCRWDPRELRARCRSQLWLDPFAELAPASDPAMVALDIAHPASP